LASNGLPRRRGAIHGLGREGEVAQDLTDFSGILDGGDQAQPPATPQAGRPSAGMFCPPAELDALLDEYYRLRGWDGDGVPSAGRLAALGL
jgi:Aldehyde ferredoxin oxidoreductase, domains 2 & 3